jgi:hypothetical protein
LNEAEDSRHAASGTAAQCRIHTLLKFAQGQTDKFDRPAEGCA